MIRSPTGSGPGGERSGSFPELSSAGLHTDGSDRPQIAFRNKRKQFDVDEQSKRELAEIRNQMSEMMSYLKSVNGTQSENLNKLREDVTSIKNHVSDIRETVDKLITEQNKIKTEIAGFVDINKQTEKRIEALERNMQQLQETTSTATTVAPLLCEDIMAEINHRNQRAKNIIVIGLPEPNGNETNETEKDEADKAEVINILKMISADCPAPAKIFRLGKQNQQRNRPVKVCFSTQETAISILRKKNNLKRESIKIFSDQTPFQQAFLKTLKEELESRIASGEENLSIKYVKGVPKIVSKN